MVSEQIKNDQETTSPANKGKKYPPEIFTREEIDLILKQCSRRAPTGIRNRALFVLLWRGGLRISEALELTPKDIDLTKGTIRVLHGKGDKSRIVGIDEQACEMIGKWMDIRKAKGLKNSSPLLCTLKGTKMYSSYIRELCARLRDKAGLDKRVHAHGFRHTHSYELHFEEGAPVKLIQEQLGHSRLDTTATYLNHISPKERIERIRQRKWGKLPLLIT